MPYAGDGLSLRSHVVATIDVSAKHVTEAPIALCGCLRTSWRPRRLRAGGIKVSHGIVGAPKGLVGVKRDVGGAVQIDAVNRLLIAEKFGYL